jgi:YD repeat-containing protein
MSFTFSSTWNDLTSWKWYQDQYTITPEAESGMATSPALNSNQAVAVITDPLSNKTTYTLDSLGLETKLQLPDGTTQTWQLNSAGLPTLYTDQLSRVTTMVYNTAGDLTQLTFPDGSSENFLYDSTFHKVTQIQDTLGNLTTMTYGVPLPEMIASFAG